MIPRHKKAIPQNIELIHRSFEIQAPNFNSASMNFSGKDYLNYILSSVEPYKTDKMLEVAAGTCACGQAFAPLLHTVVCLDATAAMLQIGRQAAQDSHLNNMVFVKGYAEELPFLDDSFDILFSRLAFHHFTNTEHIFREMVRVLKPGGKFVLIDMEAAEEALRQTEDKIETLHDPSHIKNLSKNEMLELFSNHNLAIEKCETTEMPTYLNNWLELTKTPEHNRQLIFDHMAADIKGQKKTGFYPYQTDTGIYFNQKWVFILGRKPV